MIDRALLRLLEEMRPHFERAAATAQAALRGIDVDRLVSDARAFRSHVERVDDELLDLRAAHHDQIREQRREQR